MCQLLIDLFLSVMLVCRSSLEELLSFFPFSHTWLLDTYVFFPRIPVKRSNAEFATHRKQWKVRVLVSYVLSLSGIVAFEIKDFS